MTYICLRQGKCNSITFFLRFSVPMKKTKMDNKMPSNNKRKHIVFYKNGQWEFVEKLSSKTKTAKGKTPEASKVLRALLDYFIVEGETKTLEIVQEHLLK